MLSAPLASLEEFNRQLEPQLTVGVEWESDEKHT